MKEFEVWAEGYSATGEQGTATLLGKVIANNFNEACDSVCKDSPYYNSKRLSFWGCKLFDNEIEAKINFG